MLDMLHTIVKTSAVESRQRYVLIFSQKSTGTTITLTHLAIHKLLAYNMLKLNNHAAAVPTQYCCGPFQILRYIMGSENNLISKYISTTCSYRFKLANKRPKHSNVCVANAIHFQL